MSIENARSTQVKTAKSTATSTICERWDWDRGYDSAEEEADAYRKEEEEALRLIRLDPAFAGRMDEIEAAFRAPPDFGKMVAEMEAAFRMAGAKPSQDSLFEITAMTKVNGPLTKRLFLKDDGKLGKDSTGCKMWVGRARRLRLSTLAELTAHINGMKSNEALALGRLEASLPDDVGIATKARLNRSAASVTVARAKGYLSYLPDVPAPILIDIDDKGMPDEVRRAIEAIGGVWEALRRVLPELATTARIMRRSTSSCIRHAVTGEQFPGSDGLHIYILVKDGTDAKRFLYDLHNRCWHAGFGWHVVSKSGSLLERSLIDRMVYGAERLVFEAPPKVEAPLEQDRAARAAVAHDGSILDTHEACPPLSPTETAALKQALSASAAAMAPECAAVRAQYIADRGEELAERASMPLADARRVIEKQIEGVLYPDVTLQFDDPELAGKTVGDVLADPAGFDGETLADPIEGIEYGPNKAVVMRRPDGQPWIHSFAHGRNIYELRYDAAEARAVIDAADIADVVSTFVHVVLNGDLDPAEVEARRNHAAKRSGISKRTLSATLNAAREKRAADKAREARDQRAAERTDTRPQVPAPAKDAEWNPVIEALDEVLSASEALEPPMRDIDGFITQVRVRRVARLHLLTSQSVNDEDEETTRLPAPEQAVLSRMDEYQTAEMIERHIEFLNPRGRPVHLATPFVKHYVQRIDDVLPLVATIATLPIVTMSGLLLAGPGLDRETGILYRVPPEMLAILPTPEELTDGHVARAVDFLLNNWFCDVLTDDTGKFVGIAAALSIIQRSLLPERPTFFVTSGRRGGGKTTLLIMLMMAIMGSRPSASPWSSDEEERRKALFSYLLQGLPAIIWDNIGRGDQVSCPHVERSCTTALYSDRRLGVSEAVATSASVIHLFTGNNISPKGDLTSRSLQLRLEVDRADPENRVFGHPDPIEWTEANRGKILHALYTVLMANPNRAKPPQTRFKTWWRLVGSAVEHAAAIHVAAGEERRKVAWEDPPIPLNFRDLFLSQEEDDEEGAALVDALLAMRTKWGGSPFSSADVEKWLNAPDYERPPADNQDVATVLSFLFPRLKEEQRVSRAVIGKLLMTRVGEPVMANGQTLLLRWNKDAHDKKTTFWVESKK